MRTADIIIKEKKLGSWKGKIGETMTTGTIIMIICAVLLVLFEVFFKKELGEMDTIDNDPAFKGADGLSGVIGHNTEDLDIDYNQ